MKEKLNLMKIKSGLCLNNNLDEIVFFRRLFRQILDV
jgi:hypothetical protein